MADAAETRAAMMAEPGAEPAVETPPAEPTAPQGVTPEQLAAIQGELEKTKGELSSLQETKALVEKAKTLFLKEDKGVELTTKDVEIKKELLRIMPELADLPNVKQALTQLGQAAKQAEQGVKANAWSYVQALQADYGVGKDDPEMSEMIGVNIREWINKDQARLQRFYTGDKEVLREGFEHVVGKLFGPARLERKRKTLEKVANAPVVPARPGVAAGGGSPDKLDYSDRKAVRAALRNAYVAVEEG